MDEPFGEAVQDCAAHVPAAAASCDGMTVSDAVNSVGPVASSTDMPGDNASAGLAGSLPEEFCDRSADHGSPHESETGEEGAPQVPPYDERRGVGQ